MSSKRVLIVTTVAVFILDRLTKLFMFDLLSHQPLVWVIKPFFNFTLVFNRGTAFGLFQNSIPVLIVVSLIVLGIILYFYTQEKNKNFLFNLSFGLLLGGALGNFFDRLFLRHVIDFINFIFWPTFNVADMAIDFGIAGLIIFYLRYSKSGSPLPRG